MAMATRAYWLMGLLYPTADVGLFFIWLLLLKKKPGEEGPSHSTNAARTAPGTAPSAGRTPAGSHPRRLRRVPVSPTHRGGTAGPSSPPLLAPAGGEPHAPAGRHQRLEFPLVFLAVEVEAVDDFVLLLRRDEVLDDQVPARGTEGGRGRGRRRGRGHGDRRESRDGEQGGAGQGRTRGARGGREGPPGWDPAGVGEAGEKGQRKTVIQRGAEETSSALRAASGPKPHRLLPCGSPGTVCNARSATCSLQRAICNVQFATHHLQCSP